MNEKLCAFCKHFRWSQFYNEPAQYGSGCDYLHGGLGCAAGHYAGVNPQDEDHLRQVFLRAESCKDYERP